LDKEVPREWIEDIIAQALWAPSWGNTQPWEVIAATGTVLEEFKKKNRDAIFKGAESKTDIPIPTEWPDALMSRYKDVGKSVLSALGIGRGDKQARVDYYGQMNCLFDAQVLLFFVANEKLNTEYTTLDCGLFIQNICLLAAERGLGTCLLAASIMYPEIAHDLFSIPKDKRLIIGMGVGWPDTEAEVNKFQRKRGGLGEFLSWAK
jgi:nitroreductase